MNVEASIALDDFAEILDPALTIDFCALGHSLEICI